MYHSVEIDNLLAFEKLSETLDIKASSCDHEAGHTCSVNGLLALLLELERDLVLDDLLDRLGGHGGTLLLNHLQVDGLRVAVESYNEVGAEEADTFARCLELFCELGQVGDVKGGGLLLRLAEEQIILAISQDTLDLKFEDLLLLLLVGSLQVLGVIEEAKSGVFDLLLVDTPSVAQVIQDVGLGVHHVNSSLLGHVLKTHNTIRDT